MATIFESACVYKGKKYHAALLHDKIVFTRVYTEGNCFVLNPSRADRTIQIDDIYNVTSSADFQIHLSPSLLASSSSTPEMEHSKLEAEKDSKPSVRRRLPPGKYFVIHALLNARHPQRQHAINSNFPSDKSPPSLRKKNMIVHVYQDDLLHHWVTHLRRSIFSSPSSPSSSPPDSSFTLPPPRKLLVLYNPHSGSRKAEQILRTCVMPILSNAHVQCTYTATTHAGHANEIARSLSLDSYDGIVSVSGDGLLHEIVQGLLTRPTNDSDAAIKIPLCIVPAGSGNGLAVANGCFQAPELAAFYAAQGRTKDMDILCTLQRGMKPRYCFLSVTWGFIADVDLGTENMRWMGSTRFTVGAVQRALSRNFYRGRLRWVAGGTADDKSPPMEQQQSNGINGPNLRFIRPFEEDDVDVLLSSKVSNLSVGGNVNSSNSELDALLSNAASKSPMESADYQSLAAASSLVLSPVSSSSSSSSSSSASSSSGEEKQQQQQQQSPKEDEAEKKNKAKIWWDHEVEDDVELFVAGNVKYLSSDSKLTPRAAIDDGCVDICMLRRSKPISKLDLVGFLLKMETGVHLDHPGVEYFKCKAFELEPLSRGSFMDLDGEMSQYSTVRCEVLPGLGRIMM